MPAAAMSWIAPTVLGVAGLAMQSDAAGDARKQANKAQSSTDALNQRSVGLFDKVYGTVADADKAGFFDPENTMSYVSDQVAKTTSRTMENAAGDFLTKGGLMGDSELRQTISGIGAKSAETIANLAEQVKKSSLFDKLGAYKMASTGDLSQAYNSNAQTQAAAEAKSAQSSNSMAGIISGIMPYISNAFSTVKKTANPTLMTSPYTRPGSFGYNYG